MAHELYLKGEYGRTLGLCDAALFFCEGTYPISMIYLNCMTAMCEISLKRQTKAQEAQFRTNRYRCPDNHGILYCHARLPQLEQPGDRRPSGDVGEYSETLPVGYF